MENNVCKCGSKYLYRLSTIKRRLPTTVKLTSSYIYPSMLADVLYGLPGVIDYQAYLHKDGNRENLSLKIEVLDPGSCLANNVIEKLLTIPSVEQEYKLGNIGKMAVEFVGEGGIIRTGRAKNMIIDLR